MTLAMNHFILVISQMLQTRTNCQWAPSRMHL